MDIDRCLFPHSGLTGLQAPLHHTCYLDAKQALLDSIENGITAMVQPVLEATLEKTVELVEDETVEREAALTQLNDTLQSPIGEVVFQRQREIAELAVSTTQASPIDCRLRWSGWTQSSRMASPWPSGSYAKAPAVGCATS